MLGQSATLEIRPRRKVLNILSDKRMCFLEDRNDNPGRNALATVAFRSAARIDVHLGEPELTRMNIAHYPGQISNILCTHGSTIRTKGWEACPTELPVAPRATQSVGRPNV